MSAGSGGGSVNLHSVPISLRAVSLHYVHLWGPTSPCEGRSQCKCGIHFLHRMLQSLCRPDRVCGIAWGWDLHSDVSLYGAYSNARSRSAQWRSRCGRRTALLTGFHAAALYCMCSLLHGAQYLWPSIPLFLLHSCNWQPQMCVAAVVHSSHPCSSRHCAPGAELSCMLPGMPGLPGLQLVRGCCILGTQCCRLVPLAVVAVGSCSAAHGNPVGAGVAAAGCTLWW